MHSLPPPSIVKLLAYRLNQLIHNGNELHENAISNSKHMPCSLNKTSLLTVVSSVAFVNVCGCVRERSSHEFLCGGIL